MNEQQLRSLLVEVDARPEPRLPGPIPARFVVAGRAVVRRRRLARLTLACVVLGVVGGVVSMAGAVAPAPSGVSSGPGAAGGGVLLYSAV